jgi:hypothetical protein
MTQPRFVLVSFGSTRWHHVFSRCAHRAYPGPTMPSIADRSATTLTLLVYVCTKV